MSTRVRRVVKPEKLILTTSEFMAMRQPEVERWYEDHDPGAEADPGYWANVATISQRRLRSRIETLTAWLAGVLGGLIVACLFCVLLIYRVI